MWGHREDQSTAKVGNSADLFGTPKAKHKQLVSGVGNTLFGMVDLFGDTVQAQFEDLEEQLEDAGLADDSDHEEDFVGGQMKSAAFVKSVKYMRQTLFLRSDFDIRSSSLSKSLYYAKEEDPTVFMSKRTGRYVWTMTEDSWKCMKVLPKSQQAAAIRKGSTYVPHQTVGTFQGDRYWDHDRFEGASGQRLLKNS